MRTSVLKTTSGLVLLVLTITLTVLTSPLRGQDSPLRTRVDELNLSRWPTVEAVVTIYDERGQIVHGIDENNFNVFVNVNVTPVKVVPMAARNFICLLVDKSGSMHRKMKQLKDAISGFLSLMENQDQIMIMAFDEKPMIVHGFSNDRATARNLVSKLRGRGPTAFYDSLLAAVEQTSEMPGRRCVIALTDGKDESRRFSPQLSKHNISEVMAAARSLNVPVHTIALGDRACKDLLKQVAGNTGGQYYFVPSENELRSLYRRIACEIKGQYKLVFESPVKRDVMNMRQLIIDCHIEDAVGRGTKWYTPLNKER